ncbi:Short-chain-enoyl-CoA hydratase [Desulfonema limicola]|uniref:Short-chain-enoyl-CoA hydratase n=1 Tax=Desulfonema limicola TaxID=45656 RepID=A0A975GGP8_9BACT|nr:enoyl-CoA hydratase-related protein [Desulfonema limicola]QTA80442.1 Short-chain-enoyl-CoA hydratase [Desulfonema limicola]
MSYENIIFETQDKIAKITFNRPKALNALNADLLDEFSNALDKIAGDEDIRVLVLTGAGEKSFVAGADITELAAFNALQAKVFAQKGQNIISKLQSLSIPVIAAVNGFALGGGSEMALACDFIYASENAMFGLPEITLGIIPGFGGTQRLPRLIGANMAKEMIFTGKMLPAAEAREIGIVNKVVALENLMADVMKTAKSIAAKGKVSLRAAKQAVNRGLNVDLATGLDIECDAFSICMASEDSKEGTSAFLEKRKPEFKGNLK